LGKYFGAELQQAFAKAVANAVGGTVDLGELIDEFEVILCWAKRTLVATTVIEKLHKSNRELARSRGLAKNRDCLLVQLGFELSLLRKRWESERGHAIVAAVQGPGARDLMEEGDKRAGATAYTRRRRAEQGPTAHSGTTTRAGAGGNPYWRFLAKRRRQYKEGRGDWTDRKAVEATWRIEWDGMTQEQRDAHDAEDDQRRTVQALEGLTAFLDENLETGPGSLAEPQPLCAAILGVYAYIGDHEFPISAERVANFVTQHSARGGTQRLGNSLAESRVMFLDDPGMAEECEGAGGYPEPPGPDRRCVEIHPGYCPNMWPKSVQERTELLVEFLHLLNWRKARVEEQCLEPLIILEVASSGSEDLHLYAGSRIRHPVALYLRCAWYDGADTVPNPVHDVEGRWLSLLAEFDGDGNVASAQHATSWQLCSDLPQNPDAEVRFRSVKYRFPSEAELTERGIARDFAMSYMVALSVSEDLMLGDNDSVAQLVLATSNRKKAEKIASKAGVRNDFIADIASLLEVQVRTTQRTQRSQKVQKPTSDALKTKQNPVILKTGSRSISARVAGQKKKDVVNGGDEDDIATTVGPTTEGAPSDVQTEDWPSLSDIESESECPDDAGGRWEHSEDDSNFSDADIREAFAALRQMCNEDEIQADMAAAGAGSSAGPLQLGHRNRASRAEVFGPTPATNTALSDEALDEVDFEEFERAPVSHVADPAVVSSSGASSSWISAPVAMADDVASPEDDALMDAHLEAAAALADLAKDDECADLLQIAPPRHGRFRYVIADSRVHLFVYDIALHRCGSDGQPLCHVELRGEPRYFEQKPTNRIELFDCKNPECKLK
jgi:hypothetical protein